MGRYHQYSEDMNRKLREEGRGKGEGAEYRPWIMINADDLLQEEFF